MLSRLIKRIAGRQAPLSYEEQRQVLEEANNATREALASDPEARPEVLYYLAEDESPSVRQNVAGNPSAPVHADLLLANDVDDEVRVGLAHKISRLIPDLQGDDVANLRDRALEVLAVLAEDQLVRVRAIVAEELKTSTCLPHAIAKQLASDVEAIVAAPILEYSPMLSDVDLIELVAAAKINGALPAVARRQNISADVADAVVATCDVAGVAALLTNESAQLREETLDTIIEQAIEAEALHPPLVVRPELSIRAVRRIAGFVATELLDTLAARRDLDPELRQDLNKRVRQRLDEISIDINAEERDRADHLLDRGLVDDELLMEEITAGHRSFVEQVLARCSNVDLEVCVRILRSRRASAITAFVWKAGFSMRTAMAVQSSLGQLRPQDILNARNGTEFPLSEEEMQLQLSIFTGA